MDRTPPRCLRCAAAPHSVHSVQVMDIEDLHNFGAERHVCPFYLAREMQKDADIVFLPYNYLIDARIRKVRVCVRARVRVCLPIFGEFLE